MPVWAHSGRELFYLTLTDEMVAVPVDARMPLTIGDPAVLFELGPEYLATDVGVLPAFDISRDDQRFVMIRAVSVERPLVMVENFLEELKAKLGGR